MHAITDALLGAVAAPDIGSLFSPSDPRWKGADSALFLAEAVKRVHAAGYAVVNLDSTLILAAPKIGPHAVAIRTHVAKLLGIPARLRWSESEDSGRHGDGQCRNRACRGFAGEESGEACAEETGLIV